MLDRLTTNLSVGSHQVQRCDEYRTLIIDTIVVKFTPMQYRVLISLLNGQTISDIDLIRTVFGSQADLCDYKRLRKHIDKARVKLRSAGLDICRMPKRGYVLVEGVECKEA